jgi:hypothetical protein
MLTENRIEYRHHKLIRPGLESASTRLLRRWNASVCRDMNSRLDHPGEPREIHQKLLMYHRTTLRQAKPRVQSNTKLATIIARKWLYPVEYAVRLDSGQIRLCLHRGTISMRIQEALLGAVSGTFVQPSIRLYCPGGWCWAKPVSEFYVLISALPRASMFTPDVCRGNPGPFLADFRPELVLARQSDSSLGWPHLCID